MFASRGALLSLNNFMQRSLYIYIYIYIIAILGDPCLLLCCHKDYLFEMITCLFRLINN